VGSPARRFAAGVSVAGPAFAKASAGKPLSAPTETPDARKARNARTEVPADVPLSA
jgi:hypothetical protein